MKAAVYYRYGPPSVISIADVPKPEPNDNEVLIKVTYSSVNRTDTGFRSAEYVISRALTGLRKPKKNVLGTECAGVIESVGSEVTKFKPGDRVVCFDDESFGCNAEYKTMRRDKLITHIPQGVSFKEAAVSLEGAHYMLFYIRAAKISKGTKVLVNGGTGAIGSAAVQILAHMGVDVDATAPTDHMQTVQKLGANKVFDWQKDGLESIEETYEVVFDAVGKSTFGQCKRLLKPGGVYMSTELGPGAQNPFLALATKFLPGKKVLFPIPKNRQADAELLMQYVVDGVFKPPIDSEYELKDIVAATEHAQSGTKIGNISLKV